MKNEFNLFFNSKRNMLTSVIFQLVVFALVIALCFLIFSDVAEIIMNVFLSDDISTIVYNQIESIRNNTFNSEQLILDIKDIIDNVREKIEQIPNAYNSIILSYFMGILILSIYRMINSISDYAVVSRMNEFMSSNVNRPMLWFFVKKFIRSLKYVVIQFFTAAWLDAFLMFGCFGLLITLFLPLKTAGVVIVGVLFIGLYSLRYAMFTFFLPTLVNNEELTTRQAFWKSIAGVTTCIKRLVLKIGSLFFSITVIILLL
ncbi:MAG: hypothetical protein RR291_05355, partial [Clostridia bacterium]